jgi:hypothetical protein
MKVDETGSGYFDLRNERVRRQSRRDGIGKLAWILLGRLAEFQGNVRGEVAVRRVARSLDLD